MRTRILAVCLASACAGPAARVPLPEVQTFGSLRAMFHEGHTQATAHLSSLPDPELYALGALAELAGEVMVLAGEVIVSQPDGEGARTIRAHPAGAAATLLVTARVPAWQTLRIERQTAFADLDAEIERLAGAAGIPAGERFPFLLEGEVEDLRWHVIDGRRLAGGGGSHADHLAAAVHGEAARARATLLGFFSSRDEGVFTHLGSRTHVHCLLTESGDAGHVDHVTIPTGTVLRLPALHR